MNYKICREKPYPLGCYIDYDNSLVVRAVFKGEGSCGIALYPDKSSRHKRPLKIELPASAKRGNIFSARIQNIADISDYASYNYFEGDKYFCDPYAKHVLGLEGFGRNVRDSEIRAKLDNRADRKTSGDEFDWGDDTSPFYPYEDSFVYLLHVRGFTKSSSSGVQPSKRGSFAGIIEKIPYIKSLGVTTVELMPVIEMNELENPAQRSGKDLLFSKDGSISNKNTVAPRLNYWGYKRGFYFAPRTSYCENPHDAENEFKSFIKTMHKNGLEVVLQFYFEDDESDSLIIDALRYWRCTYHVDGFHLKGARIPARQIAKDPLFSDIKLWYDWFDYNDIYQKETLKRRYLAEYNNAFMYSSRRFLKSDDNSVNDFLKAMISNGTDHGVVNYICDYEGFRLSDLVSYEHKHNEENGENNKDGTDNNLSWNCGIEGRTRKHAILELRKKQIKNILTMLFMAQGTPMLYSGDEFAFSQAGNNNPYCQDNETGWVDWKSLERNSDIVDYVRFLSKLRFGNKILHESHPFKLMDYISCGFPDLSCHGREAWRPDLSGHSHLLGMLYCGLYEKKSSDKPFIYVVYNMHWTDQELAMPKLPDGYKWSLIYNTDYRTPQKQTHSKKNSNLSETISDRSVRIYEGIRK